MTNKGKAYLSAIAGAGIAYILMMADRFWLNPEQSNVLNTVMGVLALILVTAAGGGMLYWWFRFRRRWGRDWRKVIKQKSDI
jgi:hypothetical protein